MTAKCQGSVRALTSVKCTIMKVSHIKMFLNSCVALTFSYYCNIINVDCEKQNDTNRSFIIKNLASTRSAPQFDFAIIFIK